MARGEMAVKPHRTIRPSIKRFINGFISGAGWAVGFGIAGFFVLMFLAAAWRYAIR